MLAVLSLLRPMIQEVFSMSKKRAMPEDNRIPLTFEQAIDVLLAVDPKKLPPVVRPGNPKAKKKAKRTRAKSTKNG